MIINLNIKLGNRLISSLRNVFLAERKPQIQSLLDKYTETQREGEKEI